MSQMVKPPGCRTPCPRTRRLATQDPTLVIREPAYKEPASHVPAAATSRLILSRHCCVRNRHTATPRQEGRHFLGGEAGGSTYLQDGMLP